MKLPRVGGIHKIGEIKKKTETKTLQQGYYLSSQSIFQFIEQEQKSQV